MLAIAQPGNLGDDETAADTTTSSTSSTTSASSSTSSSTSIATSTTAAAGETTSTTAAVTPTTAPTGSGLDGEGSGQVPGGVANTGGPAWILPVGGALLLLGAGTRRLARP